MPQERKMTNVLTVDVEDWYMDTDISTWELYEDRIVESTNKIIKLLNESDTKATFFILGYVAEHFPELVERIRDEDHEVATHGYSHTPITQQTPSEFEEDVLKSVGVLEKITGDKVMGYRACQFTVMEETAWAIRCLEEDRTACRWGGDMVGVGVIGADRCGVPVEGENR